MGCQTAGKGNSQKGKGNRGAKGAGKGKGAGGQVAVVGGADKVTKQLAAMTAWMEQAKKDQAATNAEQSKATAKLMAALGAKTLPSLAAAASLARAAGSGSGGGGRQYWTCGACGDGKCFATRETCHK